mgnify:CR=1 FL=1
MAIFKNGKKRRGKLLTFYLILSSISLVSYPVVILNPQFSNATYNSIPSWYNLYQIALFTSGLVSIIGLWKWKKWAVYLFFGFIALSFLKNLILNPVIPKGFFLIRWVLVAAIAYWIISRKRRYFE